MAIPEALAIEILNFLGFRPLSHEPELPIYVDYHVVRDRHSSEYYCMQRHPRLVTAACLVVQSDFRQVQM